MQIYKKYHSDVKTSYALGIHEQVLPYSFTKDISRSTSFYWKKENQQKYIGGEFADKIQSSLDDTKLFLDERLVFSRKTFVQFARLYITIINIIGKDNLVKLIKNNRDVFLNAFENISDDFPVNKNILLRFLGISKHRYMIWLNERTSYCNNSIIGQCFKRRPNQISSLEINVLKRYMNNPKNLVYSLFMG